MIGKIAWGFFLISLAAWPVRAAEVATQTEVDSQTQAQETTIIPSTPYTDSPFEQSTTTFQLGDVLGGKAGYIHPFLSAGGFYTDNLFNREFDRKSDFVARITPGIWAVLPASRYQLIHVNTLNTAPGGMALSRFRTKGTSRIQAYGKYQADILQHDKYTSEDQIKQRAEGYFRYNFRGGLSVEVLDLYELDHDAYGTGTSRSLDKFKSNLVSTTVAYEISPKTSIEGEYGFYTLNYDAERNEYRNRDDHSFAGRFFYRFLPKTSAFVEYDYIDLSYDEDVISDSQEHQVYGGLQWIATYKTRLRAKVGYGVKDFDAAGSDEAHNILAEIQMRHRFTPKTYVDLKASRQTNETEIEETAYILSQKIQLTYYQRILPKLLASANVYYKRNSYRGGGDAGDRLDEYYSAGLNAKYSFTNWLALTAGYAFIKRNSNSTPYDYDRNNVFVSLLFAL